jgi:flagellar protein FlaG
MDIKNIGSVEVSTTLQANTGQRVSPSKQFKGDDFQNIPQDQRAKIIEKTAEDINKKLKLFNSHLKIEIDNETNIQVVKVVDNDTKEVIRQIPSEEMLKIAKYIDEITGLLFKDMA